MLDVSNQISSGVQYSYQSFDIRVHFNIFNFNQLKRKYVTKSPIFTLRLFP